MWVNSKTAWLVWKSWSWPCTKEDFFVFSCQMSKIIEPSNAPSIRVWFDLDRNRRKARRMGRNPMRRKRMTTQPRDNRWFIQVSSKNFSLVSRTIVLVWWFWWFKRRWKIPSTGRNESVSIHSLVCSSSLLILEHRLWHTEQLLQQETGKHFARSIVGIHPPFFSLVGESRRNLVECHHRTGSESKDSASHLRSRKSVSSTSDVQWS